MTTAQRIEKIDEFLNLQRYLFGLTYQVLEEPETDGFVIEFTRASERQLSTLRHRLRLNEMMHIRCRAKEIEKFEKPMHKKRR